MTETKFKAKLGMEKYFDLVNADKENFETERELAKAEAVKKVDEDFAERKNKLDNLFNQVADAYEVEVEEVVEEKQENVEEVENVENVEEI
jgi:hypothetical protein